MPAESNPSEARLREIFAEALARQAPEERRRYLDGACGGDRGLRSRLESLLRAHERAGEFLELNAHGEDINLDAEAEGTVIGPYRLMERLGAGGFGVVYRAEQTKPIQREVALKIIKLGMDTREVIARFEAERQALALMHHPNIAQVYDAGATETGRPYFVMELVPGEPITDYCDAHQLPTEERLQLFLQVCDAVQHAHKKGIVHRDLKPSNVVVTLQDGKPVPKIIDFGIAKMLQGRDAGRTTLTRRELFLGTPAYMSPEQVALAGEDVDERSDIYSLGVLLYELLTGTMPFETERLRRRALDEVRQVIQEENPPKPSTRLQAVVAADVRRLRPSTGQQPTEAEIRASSRRLLQIKETIRKVHGDLDWIVMKTLEKERARRYDSASSLADDLLRHLRHQPVLAGPPSAAYRLGKFARRRRSALLVAGSVAAIICAAVSLSYWQAGKTRQAERRAAFTQAELMNLIGKPATGLPSDAPQAKGLFSGIALVEKAAALSPDEKYLAYTDSFGREGAVAVRQLDSGKVSRFTGRGKDVSGLYIAAKELYADAVGAVTTNRPAIWELPFEGYLWSPDSQWLAYLWNKFPGFSTELRIVSPEMGGMRIVLPGNTNVYYDPLDWSPDGKWLVCCRLNQWALALVSISEGQIRELDLLNPNAPSDAFSARPHARFSPDGKYVVYDLPTGEGKADDLPHTLYVTEVATGIRRHLGVPGNCRTPIWSPTQPVILFTSDRLGTRDLWGVRVQEGKTVSEPFPVQYGLTCSDLRLTRAGKLLVYRDVKPGDGYTIAAAGANLEPLKVESLPGHLYFTMENRVHALTVKGAKASVTPVASRGLPSRALHGGHRWFLEIRSLPTVGTNEPRRELFAVRDDAEPEKAIQLTDRPPKGQMADMLVFSVGLIHAGWERDRIIGWARDANRGLDDGLISWCAMKPEDPGSGRSVMSAIYTVRVAFDDQGNLTGLAEPVFATPLLSEASHHDWSPDGRRLVYASPGRLDGTNVLRIFDVETRRSSTLTAGEAPAWSPDGNWITFHCRHASLHIIRPDGSGLRTLGRDDPPAGMKYLLPRPGFYRMVWSPDSKGLAYDYWAYGGLNITYHELFYRALDGGEPERLTGHLKADASPIAWVEGER
jgi:serine/threonine protein kinase/Tol biopolymer transport system component